MTTQFTATIHDPERAAEWKAMLGTTTVPIKSNNPTMAALPGHNKTQMVYMIDLNRITPEQLERIVQRIAIKFEYTIKWVKELLHHHGIPILAKDITVTIYRQQAMW
jgi:hypothetical protein